MGGGVCVWGVMMWQVEELHTAAVRNEDSSETVRQHAAGSASRWVGGAAATTTYVLGIDGLRGVELLQDLRAPGKREYLQ